MLPSRVGRRSVGRARCNRSRAIIEHPACVRLEREGARIVGSGELVCVWLTFGEVKVACGGRREERSGGDAPKPNLAVQAIDCCGFNKLQHRKERVSTSRDSSIEDVCQERLKTAEGLEA